MHPASPRRSRLRRGTLFISGLVLIGLVASACADDADSQAESAPSSSSSTAATTGATTTTVADTTTTTAASADGATTTTVADTTTTSANTESPAADTSGACAVAQAWFSATAARDAVTSWDLLHPNSQTGPPLSEGTGGYQALTEPHLDELEMSWGPWASATGLECSLYSLELSYGDETGFLVLTGTVTIETTKTLTIALPVRQDSGAWLIDPFYANSLAELVEPAAQNLVLADVPVAASTTVVIDSTLTSGPIQSIIVVDGTAQDLIFDEHPTDFDLVRAIYSPSPSWSSGTHWVVAALMAENGVVSVASDRFTVS